MPGRMDRPQSRGQFYGKRDEHNFKKKMGLHFLWGIGQKKKRFGWWQKLLKRFGG